MSSHKIKTYSAHNEVSFDEPIFEKVQWLNEAPLDYKLLRNKPNLYFTLFINSSAGATWDGTYRELNLIWNNWDLWKSYSQEIVVAMGSTTATLTKKYTVNVIWNSIVIPSWAVIEIECQPITSTQIIRLVTTGWSFKYLLGTTTDLTSTFNKVTLLNESTSDATMKLNFGTSWTDRPRFWIFIRIY